MPGSTALARLRALAPMRALPPLRASATARLRLLDCACPTLPARLRLRRLGLLDCAALAAAPEHAPAPSPRFFKRPSQTFFEQIDNYLEHPQKLQTSSKVLQNNTQKIQSRKSGGAHMYSSLFVYLYGPYTWGPYV